ncbi:Uncharacterised protein [Phocoenobacter uteri]|uniref:Lipoprotein n=1 Tax=Phocoenobacter uteri TaxID=146806 RepID=A0A379CAK3_9PAST|nr:hypothetical protein [Phocoenobacter uteri]MDG6881146.1 hypothetical protein [Phocoenobacter uteri]SUB59168.1 Uncharacterised protein [Phocoenobacter uteri]
MNKQNIKLLCFLFVIFSLMGCMNTATRLWNSGPYMSDEKRKIYDICDDETDKFYSEENQRELWYKFWNECLKTKENQ